jgi:serine/threonine-protein kinase
MTGPRHVGNYTLGPRLGSGGQSEVYAGTHRFLGDAVAIKLVRVGAGTDAAVTDELIAEATRARAIDHPNVVRVLDVGRDDASGAAYLVMERVDGETLSAHLERRGPLDEAEVRRLGAEIADGMAAAHDRGIVHRDLKPANIMLTGERPKIVDFGIAKPLGDRAAVETSRRIGTPAYMAPELLTAGLVSPAADVWALGVILFQLATGQLPFDGYDNGRCPQLFELAPRVASRRPDFSPSLDALVARCLCREPGSRPATMREVAEALRAAPASHEDRVTVDLGSTEPAAVTRTARRGSRTARLVIAGVGVAGVAALAIALARSNDSVGASSATTPSPPPAADAAPASAAGVTDDDAIELDPELVDDSAEPPDRDKPNRTSVTRPRRAVDARPAAKPDAEGLD